MKQLGVPVYPISAAAAKGVKELMSAVQAILDTIQPSQPVEEEGIIEEWAIGENDLNFEVSRGMDGVMEANGSTIDFIFDRIDPSDPMSMRHFEKLLIDFGIIAELRRAGVTNGETVRLNGEEFDFVE